MDLEQQLREALTPVRPSAQVRAAVMARLSAKARPGRGRWLMGVGALGLAAAAAMVALQTGRPVAVVATVNAKPAGLQPEMNTRDQEVVLPDDAAAQVVAEPGRQPAGPAADPLPADRFVVHVLALEFQDADSRHRE